MSEHNPNQLTPEQYGAAEGWRLLDADEIATEKAPDLLSIEVKLAHGWDADDEGWAGTSEAVTYRTKLTRAELRAARGLPPEPAPSDPVARQEVSLDALREANVTRQAEWCPDQIPDLSFRGNELAGEVGEACNVIKKLERERHGWRGSRDTVEHLAEELADVVITADLAALSGGINLAEAVAAKFNATSEKNGLKTMLRHGGQLTDALAILSDTVLHDDARIASLTQQLATVTKERESEREKQGFKSILDPRLDAFLADVRQESDAKLAQLQQERDDLWRRVRELDSAHDVDRAVIATVKQERDEARAELAESNRTNGSMGLDRALDTLGSKEAVRLHSELFGVIRERDAATARLLATEAALARCRAALKPLPSYTQSTVSVEKICDECANGYQQGEYRHNQSCLSGKREVALAALAAAPSEGLAGEAKSMKERKESFKAGYDIGHEAGYGNAKPDAEFAWERHEALTQPLASGTVEG